MTRLYLLARVAGTPVAIDTAEIDAVVRLRELSPVPSVPAYVRGLTALRSRVLTVLDLAGLILGQLDHLPRDHALVCDIAGHSYAMLLDEVIDIRPVEGDPLPVKGSADPAWLRCAQGVVLEGETAYFVLSLSHFIENMTFSQAA